VLLPPYSPELNPVENLWHWIKSHHTSNRTYAGYDDLLDGVVTAWR
jgi:transposase